MEVTGPNSPELDYIRRQCQNLVTESASEPGTFQVNPDGVKARWGDIDLDPGSRSILFGIFDPDQKNLPYHRSARFMVMPELCRVQFLWRNPSVIQCMLVLIEAAHELAKRPKDTVIEPADFHTGQLLNADSRLRIVYGICTQWIGDDGNILDPPIFGIWPSFPQGPLYSGETVRKRRQFSQGWHRRRRERCINAPRFRFTPEDVGRMLGVWDAREGWLSPGKGYCGYVPDNSISLRDALKKCNGKPRDYYHAFQFIIGEPYSSITWGIHLGAAWPPSTRRVSRARGQGRPRGSSTRRQKTFSTPKVWKKSTESLDGSLAEREAERLCELLRKGVSVDVALTKVELPAEVCKMLIDPANWHQVSAWIANGCVID